MERGDNLNTQLTEEQLNLPQSAGEELHIPSDGELHIPKPSRTAYINFIQDFSQSYKGDLKGGPHMIRQAAQVWQGMGERERKLYVAVAAKERLNPRPLTTRAPRVYQLRSKVKALKETLAGLKMTAKKLESQRNRGLALNRGRQRTQGPQRRTAAKTSQGRQGNTHQKRPLKKATRVVQRPRLRTAAKTTRGRQANSCQRHPLKKAPRVVQRLRTRTATKTSRGRQGSTRQRRPVKKLQRRHNLSYSSSSSDSS